MMNGEQLDTLLGGCGALLAPSSPRAKRTASQLASQTTLASRNLLEHSLDALRKHGYHS